jgi:MFS family permease
LHLKEFINRTALSRSVFESQKRSDVIQLHTFVHHRAWQLYEIHVVIQRQDSLYNRQFSIVFAYNFFMALNFTNNAIYPLYVKEMGGTAETVGWFMGVASLSAVLLRPLIGWMIDRFGSLPVMRIGSLAIALPSLGYLALLNQGLSTEVWILRLIHGFGFGAHFSAFFTHAARTAPPGRRNESIAMFGFSGLGANLMGPLVGELVYDHYGMAAFFLLITGFGVAGFLLTFFADNRRAPSGEVGPSLTGAMKLLGSPRLRLTFTLAVLLSICYSTPQAFLGPLARERFIANFGLYYTGYAIAGMGARLVGRTWGDRFGLRRVMIPGYFLYALAMLVLFVSQSRIGVTGAGLLAGVAHGFVFPAVNSLGFSESPPGHGGSVIALLTGMMDAGTVLATFALGLLAEYSGFSAVFPVAAGAGFLASAIITLNIRRRPEIISRPAR